MSPYDKLHWYYIWLNTKDNLAQAAAAVACCCRREGKDTTGRERVVAKRFRLELLLGVRFKQLRVLDAVCFLSYLRLLF